MIYFLNNANKKVIFKNCLSLTKCISRISNTQINDAYNIDVMLLIVMLIYNLIEFSDNYLKNIWKFMATLQKLTNCS